MKLLVISTALENNFVALVHDEKVKIADLSKKGTSEFLLPEIEKLLKKEKIKAGELDAVSVCIGPGSFTGIRVGLATAKAFCVALNTPIIAFNTFDVFNAKNVCLTKANSGGAYVKEKAGIKFLTKEEKEKFLGKKVQILESEKDYFGDFKKVETVNFLDESIILSIKLFEDKKILKANEVIPFYIQKSQAENELELNLKNAKIEKAKIVDVGRLCEIERECFSANYSKKTIENEIKNKSKSMFVLKIKNDIVGYSLFSILQDEAELERVCIVKKYRRLGLAERLLKFAFSKLNVKKCYLEVNKKNENAISLYKKIGFEKSGERKNYYGEGEDAVLMSKVF